MSIEGFNSLLSPSFEPLTHRSLAHSQGHRDILLFPALFFQAPCPFASFFSPIGFFWCSHTSYFTTSLLLPAEISKSHCSPPNWYDINPACFNAIISV